jgi:succinoglycan biosynthesis protein ExoL
MLRCRRTFDELRALATQMDGRVEVLIAGKPSLAEFEDFSAAVEAAPHMRFMGAYQAEDLPSLYGRCHFAWTIDWFEEGLNSSWLLPTRLYEASALGVVPIALQSVEAGRWLADSGAGLCVAGAEELGVLLSRLSTPGYARLRAEVAAIPSERLTAGLAECQAFVAELESLIA